MASCLHLRVFCFGNIVILTVQLVTTYYIYIHYRDTTELWDATELGHSPFLLNWSQVLENS